MLSNAHHAAKAELLGVHIAPEWTHAGAEGFDARVNANAAAAGLELTDAHWAAIRFVTNVYADHGEVPPVRLLAGTLEQRFASEGGRRFLYQIFPDGPIRQICQLAGLEAPPYVADRSFGYSY
ncbi:MAG: TusE/DsrC/DsvC family sulfur relay protein [Thiotrichales bacterium]